RTLCAAGARAGLEQGVRVDASAGRGGGDAGGDQAFGELGGDAEGLHQQLDRLRAGIDGLDTVFLDVDAPADETRGEARVLPLANDGAGKILAGYHHKEQAVV